eukprot:TRINITY_DN78230_c0_g1_i1.p1 TRINITY_DN78230_c0_g1~~TRINITY_DN78230_c0_g1_i1.p1  ORF type:complete len:503 (+),score=70.47 TRINITY_DN78230_c0_g1_i1:173-1510(+)
MTIGSGWFACIPVRVARSWLAVLWIPSVYLGCTLPFEQVEQSRVLVLSFAAMMTVQLLVLYIGRVFTETSDRRSYMWQDSLRKQVAAERVMRYSAEHEAECGPFSGKRAMSQSMCPLMEDSSCLSSHDTLSSEVAGKQPRSAPSVCMHPPVYCLSEQDHQTCENGDCVPGNYVVQTAKGVLQPLSTLSVGEQILCMDAASSMPRFVEVTGIRNSTKCRDREVAKVTLEDGTCVEATLDHPMPIGSPSSIASVMAGKLQPWVHSLVFLKKVSLQVTAVEKVFAKRDELDSHGMISVSIGQPERFGILMSKPSKSPDGMTSMFAVGSVAKRNNNKIHKATSSDAEHQQRADDSCMRRSMSWPKLACEPWQPADLPLPPSIGSMAHGVGRCKPCNFHRRYLRGKEGAKPCSMGAKCVFCHVDGHNRPDDSGVHRNVISSEVEVQSYRL